MGRPQPEQYKTKAEYRWAIKMWRRRTGGSLIGTLLLAAFFGAWSGSAIVLVLFVVGALGLHLYVRRTRP